MIAAAAGVPSDLVGRQALLSPERAASGTLNLIIRSHAGIGAGDISREIERAGGTIRTSRDASNGRAILAVDIDQKNLFKLAKVRCC